LPLTDNFCLSISVCATAKIASLGVDLRDPDAPTIRADNCLVLPGVIDLHTHLRAPHGQEGLFTGETASAVAGGVTMVGDFAYPLGSRFELDYAAKRARLQDEALCDYCLHTVVRSPEHVASAPTHTVKIFFTASGLGASASGPLSCSGRR